MTEQLALQIQLRDFLTEAQRKNPGYSLRALATKVKISPSSLSEIIHGKRKVSQKLAAKILGHLGTDPIQQSKILSLFKEADSVSDVSSLELSADQFHLIGDWYHFAILSLAETEGFRADPLWIAKRLGIRLVDAEAALERLHRLGFIEWSRGKKTLRLLQAQLSTTDEVRSQAIRKAHQEDLEMSGRALNEVPLEQRDYTAMTLAIDAKKLPQAKKLIREFQAQMSAFLETGSKTDVYKLCVHLLPLSKEIV